MTMRPFRVRFTIRRMLLIVGVLCLLLGLVEHAVRQRRAATLRLALARQEIATKSVEATYQNAKLTREVTEIAAVEYKEGVFPAEVEITRGQIALADSDRRRAEDRVEWASRMLRKGYVSKGQVLSERLALSRAVDSEEQALTRMSVLLKYTRDKTIKELQSEVEKARTNEQASKATLDRERAKLAKLKAQLLP
jgi:hypothetical protein